MNNKKTGSYLKFDKARMVNLEYSLEREILRTNRRGAYHCTTLVECNTRKQHGLLVVPVSKFGNANHVLLSTLDETVIQHGADFNLGIHKYDGDHYSPMGHKYIREFDCDSLPRTIYRVGGVILSKEKMFSLQDNAIYIRYTLLEAHSPTTMRFKPFLAFREINQLTSENIDAFHGYREIENGISMRMYSGYPDLFMQFNKRVNFVFDPAWHRGIEYQNDKDNGLPYKEDLYAPGYFETSISKGESIIFSASDTLIDPSKLIKDFEDGIKERTPRSSFYNCLQNSGNQFYFRPSDKELYLLNNYPWGHVNAREQFMALPGLTLCSNNTKAFEEVVDTAEPIIRSFIEGNYSSVYLKGLEEADVLLWLLRALRRYADLDFDHFCKKYGALTKDIVQFIKNGRHPHVGIQQNKLLYTDGRYKPVSWMSGNFMGKPLVHRTGCLVEINAFWYNSLMFVLDIAKAEQDENLIQEMEQLSTEVKESFINTFVNGGGYLYDYVDGHYVDWNVRPNMLLAISNHYPLLDKRQSKSVLDIVTKELLTPKGVRSLSPKSIGFMPRCEGSDYERAYSVYNGAAWPWLLEAYLQAYMRVFQRSGLSFLDRALIGVEEEMANGCIGSIFEYYDGSLPYKGHGAVSSAINVASTLCVLGLQKSFDSEY